VIQEPAPYRREGKLNPNKQISTSQVVPETNESGKVGNMNKRHRKKDAQENGKSDSDINVSIKRWIPVIIDDRQICALLDTGADLSVIQKSFLVETLGIAESRIEPLRTEMVVEGAGAEALELFGTITLTVSLLLISSELKKFTFRFLVASIRENVIFGVDIIQSEIDLAKGVVRIRDDLVQTRE